MKNVGEVIDKMDEITKVQEELGNLYDEFRGKTDQWHVESIEKAIDLLNEYIATLRNIKVNA